MNLDESIQAFLADMKREGKAATTLVEYRLRLSRFKKYLIRHKKDTLGGKSCRYR